MTTLAIFIEVLPYVIGLIASLGGGVLWLRPGRAGCSSRHARWISRL